MYKIFLSLFVFLFTSLNLSAATAMPSSTTDFYDLGLEVNKRIDSIEVNALTSAQLDALGEIESIARGRARYNLDLLKLFTNESEPHSERLAIWSDLSQNASFSRENIEHLTPDELEINTRRCIEWITHDFQQHITLVKSIEQIGIKLTTKTSILYDLMMLGMALDVGTRSHKLKDGPRKSDDFSEGLFFRKMLNLSYKLPLPDSFRDSVQTMFSISKSGLVSLTNASMHEIIVTESKNLSINFRYLMEKKSCIDEAFFERKRQDFIRYDHLFRNINTSLDAIFNNAKGRSPVFETYAEEKGVMDFFFYPLYALKIVVEYPLFHVDSPEVFIKKIAAQIASNAKLKKEKTKLKKKKARDRRRKQDALAPSGASAIASDATEDEHDDSSDDVSPAPEESPPAPITPHAEALPSAHPSAAPATAMAYPEAATFVTKPVPSPAGAAASEDAHIFMGAAAGGASTRPVTPPALSPTKKAAVSGYEMPAWMERLKMSRDVPDCRDIMRGFIKSLSAEIVESSNNKVEISFRGIANNRIKIYFDIPHGSQLTKPWPAWRHHMVSGLKEAGYIT